MLLLEKKGLEGEKIDALTGKPKTYKTLTDVKAS